MADENHPEPDAELQAAIDAFVGGDETRADELCRYLTAPLKRAVQRFFSVDSPDYEDVIQDSLLATLTYLRRRNFFAGNIYKVTAAIAGNRCRDLLRARARRPQVPLESFQDWLADASRSPLDHLVDDEVRSLLQQALDGLDRRCRDLLSGFYLNNHSIEEIRRRTGLTTVQGVYYRRAICLQAVAEFLNFRLFARP